MEKSRWLFVKGARAPKLHPCSTGGTRWKPSHGDAALVPLVQTIWWCCEKDMQSGAPVFPVVYILVMYFFKKVLLKSSEGGVRPLLTWALSQTGRSGLREWQKSPYACCCYWTQRVASRKEESPLEELVWISLGGVSACPISALHTSVKKSHMLDRTHSPVCPNNNSTLTHWLYTRWPWCNTLIALLTWGRSSLSNTHTHTCRPHVFT